MKADVSISPTKADWIELAAETILQQAHRSLAKRQQYTLVLSGGSTPAPVYARLAERSQAENLDWQNIYIFWGDERCVPPDDSQSNYRMAKENLLDHIAIPPDNIYRIMGELEPETAAQDYEGVLNAFFHNREKRFDTILLGLGDDGHTASLFPGTDGLKETQRWVIPNIHPYTNTWRISLTYPTINLSRHIIFLVAGAGKADVAANCIQHPQEPPAYPAKGITGTDAPPLWLLDVDAAQKLSN
ncbi:6-phosphogluconolactonase [bacterium]|nr:6-phosphogluconolactonase [bacterium]